MVECINSNAMVGWVAGTGSKFMILAPRSSKLARPDRRNLHETARLCCAQRCRVYLNRNCISAERLHCLMSERSVGGFQQQTLIVYMRRASKHPASGLCALPHPAMAPCMCICSAVVRQP